MRRRKQLRNQLPPQRRPQSGSRKQLRNNIMAQEITYGRAFLGDTAKGTGAISGASIATGSEVTLFTLTDPSVCDVSQMTLYIKQALGSASKVTYGIYFSPDYGVTW